MADCEVALRHAGDAALKCWPSAGTTHPHLQNLAAPNALSGFTHILRSLPKALQTPAGHFASCSSEHRIWLSTSLRASCSSYRSSNVPTCSTCMLLASLGSQACLIAFESDLERSSPKRTHHASRHASQRAAVAMFSGCSPYLGPQGLHSGSMDSTSPGGTSCNRGTTCHERRRARVRTAD